MCALPAMRQPSPGLHQQAPHRPPFMPALPSPPLTQSPAAQCNTAATIVANNRSMVLRELHHSHHHAGGKAQRGGHNLGAGHVHAEHDASTQRGCRTSANDLQHKASDSKQEREPTWQWIMCFSMCGGAAAAAAVGDQRCLLACCAHHAPGQAHIAGGNHVSSNERSGANVRLHACSRLNENSEPCNGTCFLRLHSLSDGSCRRPPEVFFFRHARSCRSSPRHRRRMPEAQ